MTVNVILTLQSCTSHYNAGTWGIVQGQLRPLLAPRVYTLPMVRSIGKTMVQGKNYGPQITVKRISTRSVPHWISHILIPTEQEFPNLGNIPALFRIPSSSYCTPWEHIHCFKVNSSSQSEDEAQTNADTSLSCCWMSVTCFGALFILHKPGCESCSIVFNFFFLFPVTLQGAEV